MIVALHDASLMTNGMADEGDCTISMGGRASCVYEGFTEDSLLEAGQTSDKTNQDEGGIKRHLGT